MLKSAHFRPQNRDDTFVENAQALGLHSRQAQEFGMRIGYCIAAVLAVIAALPAQAQANPIVRTEPLYLERLCTDSGFFRFGWLNVPGRWYPDRDQPPPLQRLPPECAQLTGEVLLYGLPRIGEIVPRYAEADAPAAPAWSAFPGPSPPPTLRYCASEKAFYPFVRDCAEGWTEVAAGALPPPNGG